MPPNRYLLALHNLDTDVSAKTAFLCKTTMLLAGAEVLVCGDEGDQGG